MLKKIVFSSCLVAGLVLSACAITPTSVTERNLNQLQNTNWVVKEIQGVEFSAAPPLKLPFIKFSNESISGSDGCNRFTGGYTIQAQHIRLSNRVSTRMACLYATDLPQKFNSALNNVTRYEVNAKELKLLDAQQHIVLKFIPAQQK